MRHLPALMGLIGLGLAGCALPGAPVEGGDNGNDRTDGGDQGEALATGAMVVAPNGRWILAQRNATSVLVDVAGGSAVELPAQVERFVFANGADVGFAVLPGGQGIVAYDLPTLAELWRATPALDATAPTLARLDEGDGHLLLGDRDRIVVLDAATGETRGAVALGSTPTEATFVPDAGRVVVVGSTRWSDHVPATRVLEIDLASLVTRAVDVPNCAAPIVLTADARRGFLAPTFCDEGLEPTPGQTWTNPDPVSVVDFDGEALRFVKNLPGFGPVAAAPEAGIFVAYLDVERMDPSMFADPDRVPTTAGPRYHLMTIDPETLDFELHPIGDLLPRFSLARDGRGLLVDATVQRFRGGAEFEATLDANGVRVDARLFGGVEALFGFFSLATRRYEAFAGDAAALDRFVQMGDGDRVFTLKTRADGTGGDLYRIDLDARSTTSLGRDLRDLGLLADGATLVLRERRPAVQVQTSAGVDWYRAETYCFSLDGLACEASIDFQDTVPFQSGPACTDYHDC